MNLVWANTPTWGEGGDIIITDPTPCKLHVHFNVISDVVVARLDMPLSSNHVFLVQCGTSTFISRNQNRGGIESLT